MLSSVSKIETFLAIIFHSTYGAVCLQLTQFSCDDCENVYFYLLVIKSEIWIINHLLGLGHETMVCAVCLTVFLLIWIRPNQIYCISKMAFSVNICPNLLYWNCIISSRGLHWIKKIYFCDGLHSVADALFHRKYHNSIDFIADWYKSFKLYIDESVFYLSLSNVSSNEMHVYCTAIGGP